MNRICQDGYWLPTCSGKTQSAGINGMPYRLPPPDFYSWFIYFIAGACGSLVRHINSGASLTKIIIEIIAGAFCAIYCSELVANIIYHALVKFDLIDKEKLIPDGILGFSGFFCGLAGIQLINAAVNYLKNHLE